MKAKLTDVKKVLVEVEYNHRYSIYRNTITGKTEKIRDPAR